MVINSQDQITEAVAYQAYGAMVPLDSIANAPEIPAREKFTGKEFDQEGEDSANGVVGIQAYHFGARVYDPEVGVWLAVDAAGQYLNPYGYSTNPVIMVDPDGNYFIGAIIGGAIGFAAGGLIGGAISGEDWSWSGALQGMMMGASLGSGIENNIIASKFAAGTLSGNRYTVSAVHHIMKTNPGLIDYYSSKQSIYSEVDLAFVEGTYKKSTGELTLTDLDNGKTITVGAESGYKPSGDPIPDGQWEVLHHPDKGYYRLDAFDANMRNDIHDPTGRNVFRLHKPGNTIGCVACKNQAGWQQVDQMLRSTSTTTVIDKSVPWWKFWARSITDYGTITVVP